MRRSLAVWIFFRVSKLYILLWIRRSRDDCGRNSGRGKPSHALRFTDADDECMESMIQPTWRATMDRVRQVFLEFPRSNSILICSLLCPRAPLSPSSPTWATRGILHHQPRERLGSKNAMLCNQFLGLTRIWPGPRLPGAPIAVGDIICDVRIALARLQASPPPPHRDPQRPRRRQPAGHCRRRPRPGLRGGYGFFP
jgi:hypothetical protein